MHPDKIADRIAGAIVDLAYTKAENPKIAVEVLIGHGECTIIAESSVIIEYGEVVDIVRRIAGAVGVRFNLTPQDEKLAENQKSEIRCGKYEWVKEDSDDKGHYELKDMKYPHMVYTRKAVRDTPPHIVLTNPTMLEYILLRGADAKLIVAGKHSLRWVVIDETHSYTGAGAAELAM